MKKKLIPFIEKLFEINLAVKEEENILVFTDRIKKGEALSDQDRERRERLRKTARLISEIGKRFGRSDFYEYDALECHGTEPPLELWEKAFGKRTVNELKKENILSKLIAKDISIDLVKRVEEVVYNNRKDTVDVVIALSNFSTSHTKFRDLLTDQAKVRYASMPLFDPEMFYGPMDVNWDQLDRESRRLAEIITEADELKIQSSNMTHLIMDIKEKRGLVDTGILRKPGSFSNLPAGEVYLAPVEGKTHGRLVIEWAPTHRLKHPITLWVEKGLVVGVEGDDEHADILRERFKKDPLSKNIAELGIGTNEKASRPDNILESEKIMGTVHVALGDNSSFGGNIRTSFHQDYVVFQPTMEASFPGGENRIIINKGKWCF
ncbi:MAG TPA: aminopeptidase [Nitrospinota bacterium]|nr:aminopeptidase [Nitrospinota bacterium]